MLQKRFLFLVFVFSFISTIFIIYLLANIFANDQSKESAPEEHQCRKRSFDQDSFVCVCDAKHCDRPEPLGQLDNGKMAYYVTSKERHRLRRFELEGQKKEETLIPPSNIHFTVKVNPAERFQTIFGFGGAITDAVALNANSLSEEAKANMLAAYFDAAHGIGYSLGRVPIGASDFSTRPYSYLDSPNDFNLSYFALAPEDLEQKIPLILAANKSSQGALQLLASPWSAPIWMKSNGKINLGGHLKGELDGPFYGTYAQYLSRFVQEYAAKGVNFWGISVQNEPELAEIPNFNNIPTMFMSNHTQRDFARKLLSPLLKQFEAGKNMRILASDDMRNRVLPAAKEIYADREKAAAIDGIAFHWYSHGPFDQLAKIHEIWPEKFIIATEACNGVMMGPKIGDWHGGWMYAWDLLNTLKHWAIGWIDWNICLDTKGGPNFVNNFVDAPILVNASADEFYKQPSFYVMAHFSRFIPRDSVRIGSTLLDSDGNVLEDTYEVSTKIIPELNNLVFNRPQPSSNQIEHIAFQTPDNNFVLILIYEMRKNSTENSAKNVRIVDEESGRHWLLEMEPNSIVTAIWRRNGENEGEEKTTTMKMNNGSDRDDLL